MAHNMQSNRTMNNEKVPAHVHDKWCKAEGCPDLAGSRCEACWDSFRGWNPLVLVRGAWTCPVCDSRQAAVDAAPSEVW